MNILAPLILLKLLTLLIVGLCFLINYIFPTHISGTEKPLPKRNKKQFIQPPPAKK